MDFGLGLLRFGVLQKQIFGRECENYGCSAEGGCAVSPASGGAFDCSAGRKPGGEMQNYAGVPPSAGRLKRNPPEELKICANQVLDKSAPHQSVRFCHARAIISRIGSNARAIISRVGSCFS
jgi:hypothetical protein